MTLNPKNKGFCNFLAMFGCKRVNCDEMDKYIPRLPVNRNGYRLLWHLMSISSDFLLKLPVQQFLSSRIRHSEWRNKKSHTKKLLLTWHRETLIAEQARLHRCSVSAAARLLWTCVVRCSPFGQFPSEPQGAFCSALSVDLPHALWTHCTPANIIRTCCKIKKDKRTTGLNESEYESQTQLNSYHQQTCKLTDWLFQLTAHQHEKLQCILRNNNMSKNWLG